MRRQSQCKAQSGGSAADYQNIVLKLLAHSNGFRSRRPGSGLAQDTASTGQAATQPTSI
ncbi:hypothetical protein AK973_1640 [Pseudomonas brassicacearum]|nr:hypothetical protein AK973_1640 [Pseudomonas brassicacearum]